MNKDEVSNAMHQSLTLLFAFATGAGLISNNDAHTLVGAFQTIITSAQVALPAVLTVLTVIHSVYDHWNKKKVPENAKIL